MDKDFDAVIDFTAENIRGIVGNLIEDKNKIIRESIVDIFEHLCSFSRDNSIAIEGWATNSAYMLRKRMIIPYCLSYDYGWSLNYSFRGDAVLNDLDRILCLMTGQKREDIVGIDDELKKRFDDLNGARHGQPVSDRSKTGKSTYFDLKVFQKGTLHLKWRDLRLWEQFNVESARGRMWLPPAENDADRRQESSYKERLRRDA